MKRDTQQLIHKLNDSLKLITAALLLALLLAALVRPAAAHTEGKMQLASANAGPFKLTVWTSPDPATVGALHVATAVVLADDASPVLDAQVIVQVAPADGDGPMLVGTASTEDSENKFLYEAVLNLERAGAYEVKVVVNGADGNGGEASFALDVERAGGFNWLLLAPVALAAVAVGAFVFLRRSTSSGGD